MDRLTEILAMFNDEGKLTAELTLEEAKALDVEMAELFKQVMEGQLEGIEAADHDTLSAIFAAQQEVRAAGEVLQTKADEDAAKVAEMAAVVLGNEIKAEGEEAAPEGEGETPAETPAEVPAETPAEEPAPEAPAEPEAIAASVGRAPLAALNKINRSHQEANQAPIRTRERAPQPTFIGRDGKETDMIKFAKDMIERRRNFPPSMSGSDAEKITIGQMKSNLPDDLQLSEEDGDGISNAKKIQKLITAAMSPANWAGNGVPSDSLVATGGWVAPLETVYAIETVAETIRPVRDTFPRMGAGRGGIRFRKGISFAQAHALAGTGVWTNANDQTPGINIKATGVVAADAITETTSDSIYRQLQFGNMRAYADPEGVAAWTGAVASDWASAGEVHLLDALNTASNAAPTVQHLGAARDFLNDAIRAASQYRSRNRMNPRARLRAVLPAWLLDAVVVDLMESQAAQSEFFSWNRDTVVSMLNAQNINVTEYVDSRTGGGMSYQGNAQGNNVVLLGWKATAEWFLFHEGAYVFLDSGTLDLGLVRDSTLNKTNDYKIFAENFEGLAYVGVESMKITTNVCVSGTAALAIDNHTICVS